MAKRSYRSRAKAAWGNRRAYYSTARSYASRAYNKSGLNLSTPFIVGAAASVLLPQQSAQVNAIAMLGASAPIKGFGAIKGAAQGYIFGEALAQLFPGIVPANGILGAVGVPQQNIGGIVI